MSSEVSNTDDIIDSRDVIARIDELAEIAGDAETYTDEERDEAAAELKSLRAFAAEGEGFADWEHGETLIRDSHFEDYAQELAEEIGAVPEANTWPTSYIDWERAADALQMDYSAIEFDGVTYWGRS